MSEAVNHHYVPQFYLRNFAEGVGRRAKVFAFDASTGKSFTTLVRNVASKRNFNLIDAEGFDPNFIENESAKIESQIAPYLMEVIGAKSFPTDEHKMMVMELAANMSARNPALRGNMVKFHREIAHRLMSLSLATKERWDLSQAQMPAGLRSTISYKEMKDFFDSGGFELEIDQTYLIQHELDMLGTVYNTLMARNWCFISTLAGDNQFITSDHPTVLMWSDNSSHGFYSPGHGLPATQILLPLSPTLVLVGQHQAIAPSLVLPSDQVTIINTRIARHSINQLYARSDGFRLNLKTQASVNGRDLPAAMRAQTRP